MKNVTRSALTFLFSAGACSAQTQAPAQASAHNTLATFTHYCTDAPPRYESVDRAATAAGLRVNLDRPIIAGARQKQWLIARLGQPLALSVEGRPGDPAGTVTCEVADPEITGPELAAALMADARFGSPAKRVSPLPSGGTALYWALHLNPGPRAGNDRVMLAYGIPGLKMSLLNVAVNAVR